ncbi:unnamed protein product [Heligmosomoides polygyrus]|uniref:Uncharacterized protein n=1 Tax=Heligmosomoides polygyrus TaxID=6339 RepID=A0A183GEL5_HELPZ|nr:unnamed protein product [Heligmosomoides polygyrus]
MNQKTELRKSLMNPAPVWKSETVVKVQKCSVAREPNPRRYDHGAAPLTLRRPCHDTGSLRRHGRNTFNAVLTRKLSGSKLMVSYPPQDRLPVENLWMKVCPRHNLIFM